MFKKFALATFLIVSLFTYGTYTQDEEFSIETTECQPEDFVDGQNCTLSCTVDVNDADQYELNTGRWQYYTTDEDKTFVIYEGSEQTVEGSVYTLNLTLTNYNAGTYTCLFNITNVAQLNRTFHIAETTNGAYINETCTAPTDCYAKDATCFNNTDGQSVCRCIGQYHVPLTLNDTATLACLKSQTNGSHCYTKRECLWPGQKYDCIDNQCTCKGNWTRTYSYYYEQYELMCLKPANLTDPCFYNAQCQIADVHSLCVSFCVCESGYVKAGSGASGLYCKMREGIDFHFTGWAIAGIVIGCLVGVAVLVGTLFYFIKKRD